MGADLIVYRNDEITVEELEKLAPSRIVISPGPGHPLNDSGISIPCIKHFAGKIPILGVCMGLQSIYAAYTGIVEFAGEILHGKTSPIVHDGKGLYAGLPADGVVGTRYHSLAAQIDSLPKELVVTSKTESGVVMGIRHTRFTVEAIQYHPESILSKGGKEMFGNFLQWHGGLWQENKHSLIDEQAILQAEGTKAPVIAMSATGAAGAGLAAAAKAGTFSDGEASAPRPSNGASKSPANGGAGTILERIHAQRLRDIEEAKDIPGFSPQDLDTALQMNLSPPLINFQNRLTSNAHLGLPGVMAEMKRASPSKGIIDGNAHAGAQALAYAQGGANVISVLTEPKWFKGTLNDLTLARKAVDGMPNRPAILRKDFIIDTYQIKEARLAGADTLLLIVAMLTDSHLKELYDYSVSLGMEPLVEVNNPEEMKRALAIGAKVVGVNNRNLHDFVVDMGTTSRLAEAAKEGGVILAALSGITGRTDVEKYIKEGVGAVLVGEALMRSHNKKAFIHDLLGLTKEPAVTEYKRPLVKICGMQTLDAAVSATMAGADMIGMILAPNTKRTVSMTQAAAIIKVVRSVKGESDASKQDAIPSATTDDWFSYHASLIATHPRKPLMVGVFRNQPLQEVVSTSKALGLDVVQLHGRIENIEWSKYLPGVLVIRVFHVASNGEVGRHDLVDVTRESYHHVIALDTASKVQGQEGGAGEIFDWSLAKTISSHNPIADRVEGVEQRRIPIMLAGGLNTSNVADAIAQVQPFIIDTSSGVETDGRKDIGKIQAFIQAVKGTV
jgi:anthranilate synthase/indole-3-glycerol phosphate synthase/phosphoribosylanthranilate isomerase